MKKKLLSFFALAAIAIVTFAATQALRAAADDAHILWSSETPVAADWGSDAIKVTADKLEALKVGDILHVVITGVTPGTEWSAQVAIKDGTWANLDAGVGVGTGDITDVSFLLTGDILSAIKATGLIVSGNNYSATQVYYEDGTLTGSEKSIWIGSETGKPTVSSQHFTNVKAGDIIRVTASAIDGFEGDTWFILTYSGSDTGYSWVNYENMPATATATGFDIVVNEANVNQIKTDGIILNQAGYTITQVELIPIYEVTIGEGITGGSVSVDKATAAEGDEVTITATPNEGYKVKSYSVTGVNTNLAVTVNNGKFKMPADDVTVSVTFNQSVDVTIAPASGADISEAIKAELGNNDAKNVTINLAENGAYTLSGTIKAGGSVTINGNGSTIDASTGDNIVGIDGVAGFAKKADETDSDHSLVNAITFKDVTITGMKKALVRDLMTKTLLETLTIDNCVMQASNAKSFIDFDGRGYVGKVVVKNSTIWAAAPTGMHFAKYGSRPKNVNEALNQEFDIQNSTIVNIGAKAAFDGGQNFNNISQKGTANNIYTLKNNIFVNCGKSGQVVIGFNGGQISATPVWDVDKNAFNWNGADVAATEVSKAGKKNDVDIVQNIVPGIVAFASETAIADGNFKLANCAQNTAHIGDPRWLDATVEPEPENIIISPEEGADIYTALFNATTGVNKKAKDIYIYLAPGKKFTISQSIEAPAAFAIMGAPEGTNPSTIDETATMAEIDASALTGPLVQMSKTPAVDANADGFYPLADVGFLNVKVTGLAQQLFYANKVKYLFNDFHVNFCNIQVAGGSKTVIDTNGGGVIATLDMTKNTIWANPKNTGALYSSQSGQKATEAGLAVQTFNIEGNTMYNIAYGKNFCTHRQSNQKWITYDVKNNIFVDCGKSGQVIKGMNGGSSGTNPVWDIDGNIFNFDGADTSAAESTGDDAEPVKNSVVGVVIFKDATNGDFDGKFMLAIGADAPAKMPGDQRWVLTVATSQTVTTAASGYTTLVSVYPLDFTTAAGLTAYVVAADEDIDIANSKVKLTQVTEAAANTPVILLGTANTEYTITVKADAAAVTGNLLKGSATTATTLNADEAYLLKDGKFGLCTDGKLPAGKAYLPVPAGSASNELIIVIDGDVTGIDKVVTRDALENAKIYNLQGQEVKKAGKGIYIINGKKVVMK